MDKELCRDRILSENYSEFIIEYNGTPEEFMREYDEYCAQTIGYRYGMVYAELDDILPITPSKYSYKAVPKLYSEMDTQAVEATGAIRLQNVTGLNLKGQDIIIGIVDSGINYLHPAFRFSSGESRILSIWDQSASSGNMPDGFSYGAEYLNEQINEAIAADNPYDIVDIRDETGHGTFMAGVAAGSELLDENFTSPAPESMLAIVKLKQAKRYLRDYYLIDENAVAYQENDIMAGIRYLELVAARYRRPLVVCIGVGTSQGSHSGDSYLESVIDDLSGRRGTCAVVPTGNEGNSRHHFRGNVKDKEYVDVEIQVDRSFTMEIWCKSPDLLSIGIISPTGEIVPRIPARIRKSEVLNFLFENTVIYVDYEIVEQRSGNQLILVRFQNPTEGIWRIQVYGEKVAVGDFNIWLPVSEFVGNDTFFLTSNSDTTLTLPATASKAITTGGYNSNNGAFYVDSGRGFDVNGLINPDFVAPAYEIYGPSILNNYQRRSGTSGAAALTAGIAAQFFQWGIINGNQSDMTAADIKNYLIRGAIRNIRESYPNTQTGWGIVNAYNALDILR